MALAYYMDVHLPAAVTDALRRLGIDVITSQEDGTGRATDSALLSRATELNRILVTQDEDFLLIAADWQSSGTHFTGLIYGHQLRTAIGQMVEDLELIATCMPTSEIANRLIHLPLR